MTTATFKMKRKDLNSMMINRCVEVPDNLALSILVQQRAFEIGYRWIATGTELDSSAISCLIYFYEDKVMAYSGIRGTRERMPARDFLAIEILPD